MAESSLEGGPDVAARVVCAPRLQLDDEPCELVVLAEVSADDTMLRVFPDTPAASAADEMTQSVPTIETAANPERDLISVTRPEASTRDTLPAPRRGRAALRRERLVAPHDSAQSPAVA